jgi:hypothetical protein
METKRINRTYRGCVTKRWQKRENERNKIRIIALITFMLIARIALAEAPAPTAQAVQPVAEDVPLPTDWSPEGLKEVQSIEVVEVPKEVRTEPIEKEIVKVNYEKQAVVISPSKEDIARIITDKATQYGVNPQTMLRIAKCESGLDTQAKNKTSTATGTFQFLSGTWQDGVKWRGLNWTLEDRKDIYKSADMAAWFMGVRGEYERWECY